MPTSIMPFSYDRRDKVGDVTGNLILIGAVGIGLYFLFKNVGSLFSSTADKAIAANNADVTKNTTQANAATQAQVSATGQQPTLSPNSINSLSATITQLITSTGDYPITDGTIAGQINSAVSQINNTADWVALSGQFGTKQLLTGQTVDLLTALSVTLPPDYKNSIDQFFVDAHITSSAGQFLQVP